MTAIGPDWCASVGDWAAYLSHEGWPMAVGDELRLHALAEQLKRQNIELASPADAAQWFGPLLTRDAAQQQRLPLLLQTWAKLQIPAEPLPLPLPLRVEAAARSLAPAASVTAGYGRQLLIYFSVTGLVGILLVLTTLNFYRHNRPQAEPTQSTVVAPSTPDIPVAKVDPSSQFREAPDPASPDALAFGAALWAIPPACMWGLLVMRRRREASLLRGLAPRDAVHESLQLPLPGFSLFSTKALRTSAADFRRHRWVDGTSLDAARSAIATVGQGGRVALVYARRRVSPEYLLLVDLKTPNDLMGVLADLLMRLLEDGDVRVERYDYFGDPRHLRRLYRRGEKSLAQEHIDLNSLHSECPDHRVLILTDAVGFLDEFTGQPRSWLPQLRRWSESSILTPRPPMDWTPRERLLTRMGFRVVQATPGGIEELARELRDERADTVLSGVARQSTPAGAHVAGLDHRLSASPFLWVSEQPPTALQQQQLLGDLRSTLDSGALLYLQALAVFPVVHPRLSLVLGQMLDDGQGLPVLNEDRLCQLCRLPWLRQARMPDWLRLLLLSDLKSSSAPDSTSAAEQRVRSAWAVLLTPGEPDQASALQLDVVRRTDPSLPHLISRLLEKSQAGNPDPRFKEALLLAFMSGGELPPLAARLHGARTKQDEDAARYADAKNARNARWWLAATIPAALAGGWLAPVIWSGVDDTQRASLTMVLWVLAGTFASMTLIAWALREFSVIKAYGPPQSGAPAARPTGKAAAFGGAPVALATLALASCLGALQSGGINKLNIGWLPLALVLVFWVCQPVGQRLLAWVPLLVLLQTHIELAPASTTPESSLDFFGVSLVLVIWLARHNTWPDMRRFLWLVGPVTAISWPLMSDAKVGSSVATFVILVLVARFTADRAFRTRWLEPQRLDLRTTTVLLLPLGAAIQLPAVMDVGIVWNPTSLAVLALFSYGLCHTGSNRNVGWVIAILLYHVAAVFVGTRTVGGMFLITEHGYPWMAHLTAGFPDHVLTLFFAYKLGQYCKLGGRHNWSIALLLPCAVLGEFTSVGIAFIPGASITSVRMALLPSFTLIALAGAAWSTTRVQFGVAVCICFALLGALGYSGDEGYRFFLGEKHLNVQIFPQSQANVIKFAVDFIVFALFMRHVFSRREYRTEQASDRPEARLHILDWRRSTWPAVAVTLLLVISSAIINYVTGQAIGDAMGKAAAEIAAAARSKAESEAAASEVAAKLRRAVAAESDAKLQFEVARARIALGEASARLEAVPKQTTPGSAYMVARSRLEVARRALAKAEASLQALKKAREVEDAAMSGLPK